MKDKIVYIDPSSIKISESPGEVGDIVIVRRNIEKSRLRRKVTRYYYDPMRDSCCSRTTRGLYINNRFFSYVTSFSCSFDADPDDDKHLVYTYDPARSLNDLIEVSSDYPGYRERKFVNMKTRYYYYPPMDQGLPGDTNELHVGGTFLHLITNCHTSEDPLDPKVHGEMYDEKYLVYTDDHDDPNRPEVQNICIDREYLLDYLQSCQEGGPRL